MHNNNNNFFIGYRFKINVSNYTKLEIIFITRKISQIIYTILKELLINSLLFKAIINHTQTHLYLYIYAEKAHSEIDKFRNLFYTTLYLATCSS